MRGKLTFIGYDETATRITPADAGKTVSTFFISFTYQDHPRGCGENSLSTTYSPIDIGSPPRMRGKQGMSEKITMNLRITPADAGKTYLFFPKLSEHEDHPRGCGENYDETATIHSCTRITPADAGKTSSAFAIFTKISDHPRGCGENCEVQSGFTPAEGSPPRMRGKP